MCVRHVHAWYPWRPEEGPGSPGVTDRWLWAFCVPPLLASRRNETCMSSPSEMRDCPWKTNSQQVFCRVLRSRRSLYQSGGLVMRWMPCLGVALFFTSFLGTACFCAAAHAYHSEVWWNGLMLHDIILKAAHERVGRTGTLFHYFWFRNLEFSFLWLE